MKSSSAKAKKKLLPKKRAVHKLFPIVAIGASSGGLEAVTALLKYLPADTGMAYIYVQHLSPNHKSLLTSLLSKLTKMKVQEVTDKIAIRPNNFYIIPPNKEIKVTDGHIILLQRKKGQAANFSIDTLFHSLAETHKENTIGIVLSGSATDGTKGLSAIKRAGGVTFAQDDSAKISGMPKSALASGSVDFVLPPKAIAQELARLGKYGFGSKGLLNNRNGNDVENGEPQLRTILNHVYEETGVDFSHYKITTIKRRIIRRMLLYKIKSLKEYARLVLGKKEEAEILYQDLLINVTSFFRDSETHRYLKTTLLPRLLKTKKEGQSLRIWVTACSTGEEAYSIAISLLEILGNKAGIIPLQLFATDLSSPAIAKARVGEYTPEELKAVSPKRLHRFYTKSGSNYQVNKTVRDLCVFAPHNLLQDPPFSHVDFITCCNMLIYLDTPAQKKVISTLYYALNEGGFLMLGKSETVGSTTLFGQVNGKFKIYAKKKNSGQRALPELLPRLSYGMQVKKGNAKVQNNGTFNLGKTVDTILLSRYVPGSVVINYDLDILEFRGSTSRYLTHSTGKASFDIIKMSRPEIAYDLRIAIQKAIKTKTTVRKTGIELKTATGYGLVNIEVVPLDIDGQEQLLLVLFTEAIKAELPEQTKERRRQAPGKDRDIKKLKEELASLRSNMLAYTQEQEGLTQELQLAHEEAISSNEELQSVNEELETSKEEIESTNEELITTNQELQTRNELLSEAYDYSETIISMVHESMIILDKNLHIKSANQSFYKKFELKEAEITGRLLYDIDNKQWDIPALHTLLEEVIPAKSYFYDFEITHHFPRTGEKTLLLNANRIIQQKHREQLIVLAIIDITGIAKKQKDTVIKLHQDIEKGDIINATLQNLVQERTSELKEANLSIEQNKMELALNKYSNRFLTEFSDRFSAYKPHNEFFNSLVLYIAELTQHDYVFVGKLQYTDDATLTVNVKTIAFSSLGKLSNVIEYPLAGSPSEKVIEEGLFLCVDKCRQTFPQNDLLVQLAIEGFIGYPLFNAKGHTMGLIAVMHRQPINNVETVSNILKIVARRTEIELERIRYEEQLEENNKKFEVKNRQLEKMNAELESFTYVSSHDLQEPLRKIQVFTSRILESEQPNLSEKGKDYFMRIQSTAGRMQNLIRDLLAYSRTNTGDAITQPVQLGEIIEEVKNDFKELIDEQQGIIVFTDTCKVKVIPFQFRQLMYNLIANALKFSKPGIAPHITITCKLVTGSEANNDRLDVHKKYYHITVKDNGIGFKPHYHEKIFEVFQKLHLNNEYPGTGIGLAIVKKIVDNHNGIIEASSQLDEGATFTIYLPAD